MTENTILVGQNSHFIGHISLRLSLKEWQVRSVLELLADGNTIPFIARYRKEKTGSLDEVQIRDIREVSEKLEEFNKRKIAILESLQKRDLLTPGIKNELEKAATLSELEDIYLPYRQKRKTRAIAAIEKGLEPLAKMIYSQKPSTDPDTEAELLLKKNPQLESKEKILEGARDIIAEWVSEDKQTREKLRDLYRKSSVISCKKTKTSKDDAEKYRDYFDWNESLKGVPAHRILAIFRGEKESILKVKIEPKKETCLQIIKSIHLKSNTKYSEQINLAVEDSYKRLLQPALENELRKEVKEQADLESIQIFAKNLHQLLYAPPLGNQSILAIDPGFRTGCKVVCLDSQGKLLQATTIYPNKPQDKVEESRETLIKLITDYNIEVIAIGNGTAGRETEAFVRGIDFSKTIPITMVNESGASIYSASEVAREEFPDEDITVRGAVSIGRRLMDPLAELVKINPRSIGVGQYQHDVDPSLLKKKLEDVVVSCVNRVGVELNTCSKELLSYVSGLGPSLAKKIITYRETNGRYSSRQELKKITGLGNKAFEQAAGFLRIRDAINPLDASAVHPESYDTVTAIAKKLNADIKTLIANEKLLKKVNLSEFVSEKIGLPSLKDIIEELSRPGRDPREKFEFFEFSKGVNSMEDLTPGMKLSGVVTNLTAFGAFVDIGVHQDGLLHISQISDVFIKDPSEVLTLQQKIQVKVLEVDVKRKRISLTRKGV